MGGSGRPPGPAYLTPAGLAPRGLRYVTTTRFCPGLGAPTDAASPFGPEARRALAPAGLDLDRVAWARQVHGADVARVAAPGGFAGAADVLATAERGQPLAIFTADCLAVVLWDPAAPALAAAHVGWRGAVRGALPAAVAAVTALGARPERLAAVVGPSIGPCCYEVDEPVIAAFAAAHPSCWTHWAVPGRPGHWMLDLWRTAADVLEQAGVAPSRVENPRLCTACRPDLLYSYRRGHRGRLVTIAALE